MVLRAPNFDQTEYGCLKKDISGVFACIKFMEITARIERFERELSSLKSIPPQGLELEHAIEEQMLTLYGNREEGDKRRAKLREIVEKFRKNEARHILPEIERKALQLEIARQVINLYYGLELTEFHADFQSVYADEILDDSNINKAERLRKKIESAKVELEATDWAKGDILKFYHDGVPRSWRGKRIGPKWTELEMAKHIIEMLVLDWRARASRFSVPVTVNGVDIRSLPESLKKRWTDAYNLLGLDKIERQAIYEPRRSDLRDDRETAPMDSDIPESFRGKK